MDNKHVDSSKSLSRSTLPLLENRISPEADATPSTQNILFASTIAGMCAGASGVVVGFPFDTLKTRIQASTTGKIAPVPFSVQGLKSLYRGVAMPLASTGFMQALNFAVYGSVKHSLSFYTASSKHDNDCKTLSYLQTVFLAGAASGGVMSLLATPIQVVKIQFQTNMKMSVHEFQTNLQSGRKLPVVALYRGFWITAVGDIFGRGLYMYCYEGMKLFLSNYSILSLSDHTSAPSEDSISMQHKVLAAGFAGSFTWFALFPVDVIKTRVQSELYGSSGRQHLWHILRSGQPVQQLYRGCFYAVVRAAPVAASILPMYEYLNKGILTWLA